MINVNGLNITIDNTVKLTTVGGAGGGNVSFIFVQNTTASVWTISHGMGRYPSVITVDSGGNEFKGQIKYIDANNLTVTWLGVGFSGTAYLN